MKFSFYKRAIQYLIRSAFSRWCGHSQTSEFHEHESADTLHLLKPSLLYTSYTGWWDAAVHIQPYGLVGNAQLMRGSSGHMAIWRPVVKHWCCPVAPTLASDGKESACNAGDLGSIPGLGRSPGEGNGNPLQYSCLENSMDREAW